MTVTAAPKPWPRVRAVLDDAGIPPGSVRERGVTVSGYWGRDGAWHVWPEGVGQLVLEARRGDVAAAESRPGGLVAVPRA